MNKIIIKKRELDCIIKWRENQERFSGFIYEIDDRLNSVLNWREEYKDVLPISDETKQKCLIYLDSMENEEYEVCSKFIIEN